jgi:hypothetical protein
MVYFLVSEVYLRLMAAPVRKQTRSAKVDVAKLRRVRRFLGARTDSEAISKAIDMAEETRIAHQLIEKIGGKARPEDFYDE